MRLFPLSPFPLILLPMCLALHPVERDLGPHLSGKARIVFPHDSAWNNLTSRWDTYSEPSLRVAVEAATVDDVVATVKYANSQRIKLLVRNTSHGFTRSVSLVSDGLQISVRGLDTVRLDVARNVATVGGGVVNAHFVEALWRVGKRSATGNCDCVGLMGAGLGGGHGRHQGLHGLISDNILSAQVVTADGRVVTTSATENPELFWALRGAGHNFGIVVEATLRIYDARDADMWTNADFVYEDAQLEDLFSFLNEYRAVQPAEMTVFTSFILNSVAGAPARIRVSMQYGGHLPFADAASPFLALGPVSSFNVSIPYPEIATSMDIGLNMGLCLHSPTRRGHFSTQLETFKISAIRDAKTFFDATVAQYPQFAQSMMLWEMYPLQAFKAFPADETAYPHRAMNVISLWMVNYVSPADDGLALKVGEAGRSAFLENTEDLRVYVGYAHGTEDNEAIYDDGDGWRLSKLRKLKKKWDPKGVWNAYNPIF